jgi:hypothetical protein
MGDLTAGVAHQINNLLAPILASLDMLDRAGNASDRARELAERGIAAVNGATSLVQQLLAFAGRQPLYSIAVDTGALVFAMAGRIRRTVGAEHFMCKNAHMMCISAFLPYDSAKVSGVASAEFRDAAISLQAVDPRERL